MGNIKTSFNTIHMQIVRHVINFGAEVVTMTWMNRGDFMNSF